MSTENSRGVDTKSLELARHFLSDRTGGGETTILADLLAERIQDAVEDFFEEIDDYDRPVQGWPVQHSGEQK